MGTYSFLGHRDTPDSIRPALRQIIIDILQTDSDCEFLVGNQGHFDALVLSVFKDLLKAGEHPNFYVVLAYHPSTGAAPDVSPEYTLYPEELEVVPKKFAISKRNRWLVEQSDVVICFIRHWYGGAAQFVELAQKKGKKIVNLAEQ